MDIDRIKKRIRSFADSPSNVRFSAIDAFITNQLIPALGGKTRPPHGSHYTYTVAGQTFGIARRPGHIKVVYVREFLCRMAALGLYDSEE